MIKKIRLYLDTSVISYLDQKDLPERMKQTQKLWSILKTGKYEIVISSIALSEIEDCKEEKAEILMQYLSDINYIYYEANDKTNKLAQIVIDEGILTKKSFDDATHIASALLSDSDIILSWNFKHLVNIETIKGVRQISFKNNFNRNIDIYSPNILLNKGDDENG